MKTKEITAMAILLAIGVVLRLMIPGFFFGMKPDMLLIVLFLGIMIFPKIPNVPVMALACGLIAGLTTTFPGGQLPNVLDKLITSGVVFSLYFILKNTRPIVRSSIIGFVGTLVSGSIFLTTTMLMFGIPAPFLVLFFSIVLPTAMINCIVLSIIYPLITKIVKI
jgi:hypothetical protein